MAFCTFLIFGGVVMCITGFALCSDSDRIVGGNETTIEEYPWQVSLQESAGHFCGGSIIEREWILTAAHCIRNRREDQLSVRMGSSLEASGGTIIALSQIIMHPNYDSRYDYDFALLKLAKPITFSYKIKPIALPSADLKVDDGTICVVSGWGSTTAWRSEILQMVQVPILNQQHCNKQYKGRITDQMICAGYEKGGKDSCQGDSGGPLSTRISNRPLLVGVVSWGIGCARPDYAGVYARVTSVRSWIKSHTNI